MSEELVVDELKKEAARFAARELGAEGVDEEDDPATKLVDEVGREFGSEKEVPAFLLSRPR